MASNSTAIPVVQALGLTASAFLGGGVLSLSYVAVPPLFLAPPVLASRQWQALYNKGSKVAPPIAATTSLAFGYLSYTFYDTPVQGSPPKAQLYASAAVSVVLIIPFTIIFMRDVNNKLKAKAAESQSSDVKDAVTQVGIPKGESVKELLDTWALFNAVRGMFPLSAAVLGMWATLA